MFLKKIGFPIFFELMEVKMEVNDLRSQKYVDDPNYRLHKTFQPSVGPNAALQNLESQSVKLPPPRPHLKR